MSERVDADGVAYSLVETADTRGRRLYLDGEPFPYATGGGRDLQVIRSAGLTVLLVPVVVLGAVTITAKSYEETPHFKMTADGDRLVWVDGAWLKLAN